MHTVENKKVSFTIQGKQENGTIEDIQVPIDYAELLLWCVKRPDPKVGFDYTQMSSIRRVEKAINKEVEKLTFKFEDSDMKFIKSQVATMGFKYYSETFLDFQDYISELKPDK